MTSSMKEVLNKDIREMKISELYYIASKDKIGDNNYRHTPPRQDQVTGTDLDALTVELINTKNDLVLTKKELMASSGVIGTLSKDLSKNRNDLQQSRIEVQQSRLENQQTRLELMNFKNESKVVIESLNTKLDELIKSNASNLDNFYQNIVDNLDQHFNGLDREKGGAAKRRKLDAEPATAEVADAGAPGAPAEEDARSVSSSDEKKAREPMYRLVRGVDSIHDIWEEYVRGINGGPAVRDLEAKYHYRWRDDKERSILGHRRKIYAMVETAVKNGKSEEEAVAFLDNYLINEYGEKRSFAWLFEHVPEGYR